MAIDRILHGAQQPRSMWQAAVDCVKQAFLLRGAEAARTVCLDYQRNINFDADKLMEAARDAIRRDGVQ